MPSARGWALVPFVGLLPSFVARILFIHAVALIGPARAGVFLNLTPVLGPLLAVLLLGEPLAPYHALAPAMVLGGIWIAEHGGWRPRNSRHSARWFLAPVRRSIFHWISRAPLRCRTAPRGTAQSAP